MIQTLNPFTGQVLRTFDPLTPEAVQTKLHLAASAARSYAAETLDHRRFWMRRLALLLESDREDLATLIVTEVGKPIRAARAEVDKCVAVCRYYAEHTERILEAETVATEHAQSYVRWDPLGVVLAIMPWNFPLWQVFRFLAPALMGGNVCLLKHAPGVPQCALAIEAVVRRSGFPRGSCQVLLMEAKDIEAVLADDRVAAVTVTGSVAAGRAVAAQAGYLVKKCVLELGGSDPFIVLPSANLQAAIAHGVQARSLNNGQSCIAAKRFLVHNDVYDAFVQGFVERTKELKVGDPSLESTDVGPLVSEDAARRLLAQVEQATSEGGRILTGGKRLPGQGFFVEPTVVVDLPHSAALNQEETFGPLALIFRVDSLDEALKLANDTPYGLGASCWTGDAEEQERLAREIQAGSVFFNAPVTSDPRLPFGGVKRSGYGRELSAAGMREFLNAKTVVVAAATDMPQQTDFTFTPAQQQSNAPLPSPKPVQGSPVSGEPAQSLPSDPLSAAKADPSTEEVSAASRRGSVLGLKSR